MFLLDRPSTMEIATPTWFGGVQRVAGESLEAAKRAGAAAFGAIINPFSVVASPVAKGVERISEDTSELIRESTAGVKAVAGGVSSGFKWAVFLIVAGAALWAFAVVSPFVPKPKGS